MNNFNHGSLFSGIGGFDLAAEWMGWNNIFHCEWMPFPRKVLNYHFPKSISYEDITKTNFTIHKGSIDILTGGFPCQPYSQAGKRLGKEDSRHLWPEMLRAIKEIEPTYIVGENVRGLTNWNGGVVFNEVCTDLEDCGYEVQPVLLPACAVGAPHRRDRIWFVAYSSSYGRSQNTKSKCKEDKKNTKQFECIYNNWNASDSNSNGFNGCNSENEINSSKGRFNAFNDINEINKSENVINSNSTNNKTWSHREILEQSDREKANGFSNVECRKQWKNFPTESPICGRNDGFSYGLDNITFSKWRQESIKGYGNAIVPQVAYQIFKTIQQLENLNNNA